MFDTANLFFSSRPAYPWSEYPLGGPALAAVGLGLAALTVWTYRGHPNSSRGRIALVLGLRLAALLVALLTAVRPSVGVQEEPKVPSTLLVGVDLTESMTVKDAFNNQARIDAVRKTLDRCQGALDELREKQNVNVIVYRFGPPDFSEATAKYDPAAPADAKRSDYGAFLSRLADRWQTERFLRGLIVVGDGADNGQQFAAVAEAGRWGRMNCPVHTAVVGTQSSPAEARDLAAVGLSCDPARVPVKNDVTVKAVVNAYGFAGVRVKARVFFDDKLVVEEDVTLAKERDNEVAISTKAPATPGEVKVRFEVPVLPGEVSPLNNSIETYLTVTKEGVRVLVVDSLRPERARLLDALRTEKRFDTYQIVCQADDPLPPEDARLLDLENQGYDAVVIGNVSAAQLAAARPTFLKEVADRVRTRGMGLIALGGERAFGGTPDAAGSGDWRGSPLADVLPVTFAAGGIVESVPTPEIRNPPGIQTVPTRKGLGEYLMRVGPTPEASAELWADLAVPRNSSRLTGYNRVAAKPGVATVYAWASTASNPVDPRKETTPQGDGDPLLVGHQIGDGSRGRVLAFAGFDSYLWERLEYKARKGTALHHRFWRQAILWLAHQEEDEGQVYARPEYRRLRAGSRQTIQVGVRGADGGDLPTAKFDVKIAAPGETDATAKGRPVVTAPAPGGGTRFVVPYEPTAAGEYVVIVKGEGVDAKGVAVKGEARARFLVVPDVSDEMLRTAADPDFLAKLSAASTGTAMRLEDLPAFLKEMTHKPLDVAKPKPRYLPDWRRNQSKGFLHGWLVLFVTLVGLEWGLRRLWGMV